MADHCARTLWGDHLDRAEREQKNSEWIKFAARSYERVAMSETNEEFARLEADQNFRPCIMDCSRAYRAWQAAFDAERLILATDKNFRSMRELIDAEVVEERTYRIANFTWDTWEANMENLRDYRVQHGKPPKPVRVKTPPAKYVRLPNGTKIPRSIR